MREKRKRKQRERRERGTMMKFNLFQLYRLKEPLYRQLTRDFRNQAIPMDALVQNLFYATLTTHSSFFIFSFFSVNHSHSFIIFRL